MKYWDRLLTSYYSSETYVLGEHQLIIRHINKPFAMALLVWWSKWKWSLRDIDEDIRVQNAKGENYVLNIAVASWPQFYLLCWTLKHIKDPLWVFFLWPYHLVGKIRHTCTGWGKSGLQLFIWKIIQSLTNNIQEWTLCFTYTISLLLPHPL